MTGREQSRAERVGALIIAWVLIVFSLFAVLALVASLVWVLAVGIVRTFS